MNAYNMFNENVNRLDIEKAFAVHKCTHKIIEYSCMHMSTHKTTNTQALTLKQAASRQKQRLHLFSKCPSKSHSTCFSVHTQVAAEAH